MAGERLVLAELVVDSNGVVKGIKDATESIKLLPDAVNKHGKAAADAGDRYLGALEHRFLGFRHVAGALLGGFTVAGLVEGFKDLVLEAAKLDPQFSALEVSLGNIKLSAAHLVGSFLGLNETMPVTVSLTQAIADTIEDMSNVVKKTPWYLMSPLGVAYTALTQGAAPSTPGFIGPPAPAGYGNSGYNPDPKAMGFIGPPSPTGVGNKGYDYFGGVLIKTSPAVRIFTNDLGELHHAWELNAADTQVIDDYDRALAQLDKQMEALETSGAPGKKFERELMQINDALSETGLQVQFVDAAIQGFSQSLTGMAESGSLSLKKFLGEMIMAVGQAIVAVGGLMMARGFLTYNAADVAKGAGVVALGAATIAIGSRMAGSANASPSAAGGAAAAAGAASTVSRTINITIEGNNSNFIGTSEAAVARWFMKITRQAVLDGA